MSRKRPQLFIACERQYYSPSITLADPSAAEPILFATMLEPSLHLGSYCDAFDTKNLALNGISEIIVVARECPPIVARECSPIEASRITTKHYPIDDHADAHVDFANITDHIQSNIDQGINTLLCCRCGISRSPTVAIAFYILKRQMSFDEAFEYVSSRHERTDPNAGFILSLEQLSESQLSASES